MQYQKFSKRSATFKHAMNLAEGFCSSKYKVDELGRSALVEHPLGKSYVAGYVEKKRVGITAACEPGSAVAKWSIHRGSRAEPIVFHGPSPQAFAVAKERDALHRVVDKSDNAKDCGKGMGIAKAPLRL